MDEVENSLLAPKPPTLDVRRSEILPSSGCQVSTNTRNTPFQIESIVVLAKCQKIRSKIGNKRCEVWALCVQ